MNTGTIGTVPTWTWAIPLIVGVIALAGVVATVMISHRNMNKQIMSAHILKLAEMRQAWIHNLRDAMASFQSYGATPGIQQLTKREFYELGTKIELLMNPADQDFVELQASMYDFLEVASAEEKFSKNARFVKVSQSILKREWEELQRELIGLSHGKTAHARSW